MKDFIKSIIDSGNYVLNELEEKIKKLYVLGDLTTEEMEELLKYAADKVDNSAQINLFEKIVDLEHRLVALETSDYAIWQPGYVTKKGEIVKVDLNGDDEYDFAMYDGGRSSTSLLVGKIDGWYKVTSTGTKTHIITRNADGTFVLTPVE